MLKKYRVLVIDNDAALRERLSSRLITSGYEVIEAKSSQEGLEQSQVQDPDMIILDIMMPGMDGLNVLQTLRKSSYLPIIILSSNTTDITRITTLNLGADDFLMKPFNVDELIARIEAVRRRTQPDPVDYNLLTVGDITFNFKSKTICINDTTIHLTLIEWQLIAELATNYGRLIQYEQLLTKVWGEEYLNDIHLLRTWISRLRKKLKKSLKRPLIHTIRNTGYILDYKTDTNN